MGKHCKHPGRKVLARRRRLMFLTYDVIAVTISVSVIVSVVVVTKILLEGGL